MLRGLTLLLLAPLASAAVRPLSPLSSARSAPALAAPSPAASLGRMHSVSGHGVHAAVAAPLAAAPAAGPAIDVLAKGVEARRYSEKRHLPLGFDGDAGRAWTEAIEALRAKPRAGWLRRGVPAADAESVLDHMRKTGRAAELYAAAHPGLDRRRMRLMALFHDLAEHEAPDYTPHDDITPARKRQEEKAALSRLAESIGVAGDELLALWREYEDADTPEAVAVRQLDKLDAAVQSLVYARQGYETSEFIAYTRARLSDKALIKILDGTVKAAAAGKDPYRTYFGLLSGTLADKRLERRRVSGRYEWDGNPAIAVAFFDADSTFRVSRSGSVSANGPKDVLLLPWVGPRIGRSVKDGFLTAVVSNQGGVPRSVSMADADAALAYARRLVRAEGGDFHHIDFAESTGRAKDRKPGIGMLQRLERALKNKFGEHVYIDKERSFMVGDSAWKKGVDVRPDGSPGAHFSNADRLFAENAGIRFIEAAVFFGWRPFGIDVFTTARQAARFLREHPEPPEG